MLLQEFLLEHLGYFHLPVDADARVDDGMYQVDLDIFVIGQAFNPPDGRRGALEGLAYLRSMCSEGGSAIGVEVNFAGFHFVCSSK